MATKEISLILLWSLSFTFLNIGAKKISALISFDNGTAKLLLNIVSCKWFYVVVPCYALCAVLYLLLLKLMPISIIGPVVLCIATLILSFLGIIVFKEKVMNFQYYCGIVLSLGAITALLSGK